MDTNTLFTMALGLQAPWEVKNLQFNVSRRLRCVNLPCRSVKGQPQRQ